MITYIHTIIWLCTHNYQYLPRNKFSRNSEIFGKTAFDMYSDICSKSKSSATPYYASRIEKDNIRLDYDFMKLVFKDLLDNSKRKT